MHAAKPIWVTDMSHTNIERFMIKTKPINVRLSIVPYAGKTLEHSPALQLRWETRRVDRQPYSKYLRSFLLLSSLSNAHLSYSMINCQHLDADPKISVTLAVRKMVTPRMDHAYTEMYMEQLDVPT